MSKTNRFRSSLFLLSDYGLNFSVRFPVLKLFSLVPVKYSQNTSSNSSPKFLITLVFSVWRFVQNLLALELYLPDIIRVGMIRSLNLTLLLLVRLFFVIRFSMTWSFHFVQSPWSFFKTPQSSLKFQELFSFAALSRTAKQSYHSSSLLSINQPFHPC